MFCEMSLGEMFVANVMYWSTIPDFFVFLFGRITRVNDSACPDADFIIEIMRN